MTTFQVAIHFDHDRNHDDAQGDELALVMDDIREELRHVVVATVSKLRLGPLMIVTDDGRLTKAPCYNDTDGDGNCGRRLCPQCGKG